MRPQLLMLAAIFTFLTLTGCALLDRPSRLAHIQIIGPGNHTKEFVIALDELESEETAGIKLTDNYAINIDLQWLWYEFEDLRFNHRANDPDDPSMSLTPWFICKYRF